MLCISRLCCSTVTRFIPRFIQPSSTITRLYQYSHFAPKHSLYLNNFKNVQRGSGTISLRLASDQKSSKPVGYWLMVCSGMVFGAVVLGTSVYYGLLKSIYRVVEELVKSTKGSS